MATLEEALAELYSREIGISITSFPGIGWTVKLGDVLNGFKDEREFDRESLHEIGSWILDTAAKVEHWQAAAQHEPEVIEAIGEALVMVPYRQRWPRIISIEEWLAAAHPEAPLLPWIADNGAEVCSFTLSPIEQTGELLVVLYDA